MAVTIKGPLKIQAGKEVPDKIKQEFIRLNNIRIEQQRKKPKKYTKEELEKMDFDELRQIGYKFKVRDRSRKRLIAEILKAQG